MKTNYLFFVLIIVVFAFIYSCKIEQKSEVKTKPDVYVIVHGAWGGSWAFRKVDSLITAKGNIVYRPCLTGQGERVHLASPEISLSTHIKDVVNTIIYEELDNVILIGHSYGGMVVTGVADSIPERIKRIIYLDAFVPENGECAMDVAGRRDNSWINKMVKDGFLVPSWVSPDKKPPKDVPMSFATFTERIVIDNPETIKIPITYILTVDSGKKAEEDGFWPSAVRAKNRGCSYYEMIADHNPQWSAPVELVEMLLKDK